MVLSDLKLWKKNDPDPDSVSSGGGLINEGLPTLTPYLMNVKKNIRKWGALIAAIILYFVVHEGAHYLYAVSIGAFKQVNFIGLGVQIDIFREQVTDTQLGIFCLIGPAAAILAGYALVLMACFIVKSRSLLIRACVLHFSRPIDGGSAVSCGAVFLCRRRRHERHCPDLPRAGCARRVRCNCGRQSFYHIQFSSAPLP